MLGGRRSAKRAVGNDSVLLVAQGGHFRVHGRRVVRIRATVAHARTGWQGEAQVLNLGMGGACVLVPEALQLGDAVHVSFTAPTLWDPLAFSARVAWTLPPNGIEPPRAGLAFEPTDAAATLALFELVATLAL
jgi:hypothetical protein